MQKLEMHVEKCGELNRSFKNQTQRKGIARVVVLVNGPQVQGEHVIRSLTDQLTLIPCQL